MTTPSPNTKSVVDRSIVVILPYPDDTPSRRDGIDADVERKHRLYGTQLLFAATTLEKLDASTYATACVMFHRFLHRVSLKKFSVWGVALGSLLLATKVEDGPQQRTIRALVLVFDHLYRKRRGCIPVGQSTDKPNETSKESGGGDVSNVLPMSKFGPVWKEWYDVVLEMENHILRELGFTVYWIPDKHPHKFVWEFIRLLFGLENVEITQTGENNEVAKEGDVEPSNNHHHELAQRVWDYCNDSCRLDLCVRFDPGVIVSRHEGTIFTMFSMLGFMLSVVSLPSQAPSL